MRLLREGENELRFGYRELWEKAGGKCQACRRGIVKNTGYFAYLRPMTKGGRHAYDNIELLCSDCHEEKGSKGLRFYNEGW